MPPLGNIVRSGIDFVVGACAQIVAQRRYRGVERECSFGVGIVVSHTKTEVELARRQEGGAGGVAVAWPLSDRRWS